MYECPICGLVSSGTSSCPTCGSNEESSQISLANIPKEDSPIAETLDLPFGLEGEAPPIPSSDLPFDLEGAPAEASPGTLAFGLEAIPEEPPNSPLVFGLEQMPEESE